MSGRIYDINKGVPICPTCGKHGLDNNSQNFNGCYCWRCRKSFVAKEYDVLHPRYIYQQKYINPDKKGFIRIASWHDYVKINNSFKVRFLSFIYEKFQYNKSKNERIN